MSPATRQDRQIGGQRGKISQLLGELGKAHMQLARYEQALRQISVPQRPDGSWNRDREACRKVAAEALTNGQEQER